ncbi:hypothetical protein DdX_02973 [Ditylenchus destructor]|uniref:Uncharacterized protein n=1 Tax=Ditylenchus destructor TaxID=166010 RepID=A0AAD4NDI7_9BILA|nr:hypothetical protein DdX_02973 [Ditylenchus destructor]
MSGTIIFSSLSDSGLVMITAILLSAGSLLFSCGKKKNTPNEKIPGRPPPSVATNNDPKVEPASEDVLKGPKKIPLNEKEKLIKEKGLMRRKTEYPTWGDVPSEWDETKTSKKGKAKIKSNERAKEKKSENQSQQSDEKQHADAVDK